MGKLIFDYVPLTFISDKGEIKKQIRNTLILIHLFEKYNNPVRLEKLIEGTQYGYNASALQSGNNKFLRISDIHESKVNWETVPYCNCDDEETYVLKNDDILIARTGGTTGKSFKINNPPKDSIYAGYLIRIRAKATVNPDYLYLFLHSFAYWSQIVNLNERNFRPKANAENLKSLILPECPKAVQDEAVLISQGQKIIGYEGLYAEIETALSEYDKAQKVQDLLSDQLIQLENLNQAILQEAVQGKLVKQNPKDEPASELLKRIKAEKAKSGKKEKPLPPIKPAEIPFKIPESWVWCRLGEICDKLHYGYNASAKPERKEVRLLRITDIQENNVDWESVPGCEYSNSDFENFLLNENDIVIARTGGTIGKTYIVKDISVKALFASYLIRAVPSKNTNSNFMKYFMESPLYWKQLYGAAWGAGQPNVNATALSILIFPFSPLSEQTRIVAEIEKQLAKTKQLKENIIANQLATEQLLKALLHAAFEVKEKEEVNN
ncbi:MAG: restriction endonuclease subunit S [Prolixibacteraceae bacterium]